MVPGHLTDAPFGTRFGHGVGQAVTWGSDRGPVSSEIGTTADRSVNAWDLNGTARRQLAAVTQYGCGRGGFFEGCKHREDGDRVPRSPSGGSGRGKPGNAMNLMTGNGMQQARGRLRGENRRGGARPRGRNGSRRVAPSARRRASSSASCPSSEERTDVVDAHREWTRIRAVRWRGTHESQKGRSASAFERARCSGRITSALNATRRSGRRHPAASAAGPVQVEFLEGPDRRRSKTMEGGRKGQRPATK